MRTDLDHLPPVKQRELERGADPVREFGEATAISTSEWKKSGRILKIILYGTYAHRSENSSRYDFRHPRNTRGHDLGNAELRAKSAAMLIKVVPQRRSAGPEIFGCSLKGSLSGLPADLVRNRQNGQNDEKGITS